MRIPKPQHPAKVLFRCDLLATRRVEVGILDGMEEREGANDIVCQTSRRQRVEVESVVGGKVEMKQAMVVRVLVVRVEVEQVVVVTVEVVMVKVEQVKQVEQVEVVRVDMERMELGTLEMVKAGRTKVVMVVKQVM